MSIDFDESRWERVKHTYAKWWAGELDRPIINVVLEGRDPGRPEPDLPSYGFTSFYDLSVPAWAIVDRWDYDLSCRKFLGDSFPMIYPVFGTGVVAAFIGAVLQNGEGTVWLRPPKDQAASEIHWEYDPDNIWLRRMRDIYKAAMDRWEGQVLLGSTELGGMLDILSVFRPGERLLTDLYDCPDEVKRLTWEAQELWWRYFNEFQDVLQPLNRGYSDWGELFSEQPYLMLQCDFCYMIGPEMFDEFVKPELAATCKRMTNAFYHLDGPGQLPHLDSLLTIPELKGVQWIPGAGSPNARHWPEVFRKIREAGKLVQIYSGETDILDVVVEQVGSAKGIYYLACPGERNRGYTETEAEELLDKYGVT